MSSRWDWTLQCIIQGHLCSDLFTFVSAQLGESRRRACEKLFPVYIFTFQKWRDLNTRKRKAFSCTKIISNSKKLTQSTWNMFLMSSNWNSQTLESPHKRPFRGLWRNLKRKAPWTICRISIVSAMSWPPRSWQRWRLGWNRILCNQWVILQLTVNTGILYVYVYKL